MARLDPACRRIAPALAVACSLAAGAGIDLTTFRSSYAHHHRTTWNVGATAESDFRQNPLFTDRETAAGLTAGLGWESLTLSDNVDWQVRLPVSASLSGASSSLFYDSAVTRDHRLLRASAYPSISALGYHPGTDFFIDASIRTDFWLEDSSSQQRRTNRLRGFVPGHVGLGWGRVRDAWPLLKAAYIAQTLAEESVLVRSLTDEELKELAEFLSRSWTLFLFHQRGASAYYDTLSTMLELAGVTRGPLPARAIMHLEEGLFVGQFARPFGWRIRLGADVWATYYAVRRTDGDSTILTTSQSYDWCPVASIDYARPLGLRWLVDVGADYRLWWHEGTLRPHSHEAALSATAGWQVLDRLGISLGPQLRLQLIPRGVTPTSPTLSLHHSLELDGTYYLAEGLLAAAYLGWSGSYSAWTESWPQASLNMSEWTNSLYLGFKLHWGPIPSGWGHRTYL